MSNHNPAETHVAHEENGVEASETGWKPCQVNEPYKTEVLEGEPLMNKWAQAMKESDNGMCQGWKDQTDTLIIFAGLFSATVTAFTVESYQWLDETPANMLARLQLRDRLLNTSTSHDQLNNLAPAAFRVGASSVAINVLWFASLTLTLAAVVIGFLCKQWIHEYQRYDNYTTKNAVLISGLRYRGLQAWRVPEIIATLPILLQTALMLFLVGLLVLLGPLQTVVGSVVGIIVGSTFLFLVVTTLLPTFQYIFPIFKTQCPYKSSQSWSFFFLWMPTFWRFESSMPRTWALLDQWEVTSICDGMGHTLSRVYELASNNADIFRSIYSFLADTSRSPSIRSDLVLLSDFIDGLDTPRRDAIVKAVKAQTAPAVDSSLLQRLRQLKINSNIARRNQLPSQLPPRRNFDSIRTAGWHAYHLQVQRTLAQFLIISDSHLSDEVIFNRYLEHWSRCSDNGMADMIESAHWKIGDIGMHHMWNRDIASHLVKIYSRFLKRNQTPKNGSVFPNSLFSVFPGMIKFHQDHHFDPPPFTLLKDIQNWIDRDKTTKSATIETIEAVLLHLVHQTNLFDTARNTTTEEKGYLKSFAEFFVGLAEGSDELQYLFKYEERWEGQYIREGLRILQNYLASLGPSSPTASPETT